MPQYIRSGAICSLVDRLSGSSTAGRIGQPLQGLSGQEAPGPLC